MGRASLGSMRVERLNDEPIIHAGLSDTIGTNIQGPSLIAAPDWLAEPLGRYLLYFADHKGDHIRLAYANDLVGPWTIHEQGSLWLPESHFPTTAPEATPAQLEHLRARYEQALGPHYDLDSLLFDAVTPHIASPDVHVDDEQQRIVMYFHGLDSLAVQVTRVAVSIDGVSFAARPEVLGASYFRHFTHGGWHYALTMPGQVLRSRDPLSGYVKGPKLFEPSMRHCAVWCHDDVLDVFWTRVGDAPESIVWSTVDLSSDWMQWSNTEAVEVLRPELAWEGARLPVVPSVRGAVHEPVNQLRDPCLFHDGDRHYLLYAGAGESAIGIAELSPPVRA